MQRNLLGFLPSPKQQPLKSFEKHWPPKTTLRYAKIAARARREDAERFASAAAAATYRQEKEE